MSEPPRLDYRNPRDERGGARIVLQALLACGLTCGLVIGGVFVTLFLMFTQSDGFAFLVAGLASALLAGAIWIAVRARRQPNRRGWAIGIWLGLGLAGLFEGICFGGMMF